MIHNGQKFETKLTTFVEQNNNVWEVNEDKKRKNDEVLRKDKLSFTLGIVWPISEKILI